MSQHTRVPWDSVRGAASYHFLLTFRPILAFRGAAAKYLYNRPRLRLRNNYIVVWPLKGLKENQAFQLYPTLYYSARCLIYLQIINQPLFGIVPKTIDIARLSLLYHRAPQKKQINQVRDRSAELYNKLFTWNFFSHRGDILDETENFGVVNLHVQSRKNVFSAFAVRIGNRGNLIRKKIIKLCLLSINQNLYTFLNFELWRYLIKKTFS